MTKAALKLPRPPRGLIDTPAALAEVCQHLGAAQVFGFDTEFIGESSYRPVLCLVQVATDERVELIDPMALEDLGPFWDLLADPAVEKICHAGDHDLAIAWQLGRKQPQNVFDSQIGAGLAGIKHPVAYWRLVETITGDKVHKGETFSAWDQRPLSGSQFTYAVDDVRYLPEMHRILRGRMESLGHMGWLREACRELCLKATRGVDPTAILAKIKKMKGASRLDSQQLSVLWELAALREQMADERDVPVRDMLKDEALMDLALRWPETVAHLRRRVPQEIIASYGEQIIEAVRRGQELPPDQAPPLPPRREDSAETTLLVESMYASSQVICLGQLVWPSLVTNREQVEGLVQLVLQGEDLSGHALMSGWARECLGAPLVELMRGQTDVTLHVTPERMCAEFEPRD